MSRIWQSILLLWLALCVCAPAFALGLGQIQVRSQAGEPLLAEIPVVSSDPSELQQLRARLASPETFARIGLQAPQGAVKTGFGVFAAAWVGLGTLRFVWTRLRAKGRSFTPEMLGMVLGHLGIAVFLVGALLVEAQNVLREVPMLPGQTQTIGRYDFRFDGVDRVQGPNYMADRGHVQVFRDDRPLVLLHPEKRAYASGGQVMTDAGIHAGVRADIFVALGEPLGNEAWAVRLHVKPFVRWIWTGAALMALGGLVTAFDRRFRAAPRRRMASWRFCRVVSCLNSDRSSGTRTSPARTAARASPDRTA